MTDDQPLRLSFRIPEGPTANGRIYPRDVMEKALREAQARGQLKAEFGVENEPAPPVRINERLFAAPRGRIIGIRIEDDGSIHAEVEVTDTASAVDRLAAITRELED